MAKVLETTVTVKAYRSLFNNTPGTAMRTPDHRVFFIDDATQLWRELGNADAPRLQLLGRLDLIALQQLQDERFGSLLALIDYRNTEHRRAA